MPAGCAASLAETGLPPLLLDLLTLRPLKLGAPFLRKEDHVFGLQEHGVTPTAAVLASGQNHSSHCRPPPPPSPCSLTSYHKSKQMHNDSLKPVSARSGAVRS